MESFFRSMIAVLFIGLIVIGVVFFSIFIMVPTSKLSKLNRSSTSTSVAEKSPISPLSNILNNFVPGLVPKESSGEKQQESVNNKQVISTSQDQLTNTAQQSVLKPPLQISEPIQPKPISPIPSKPKPAPPEHPFQSAPVEEKDISKNAVRLVVSSSGFSPDTFTVNTGESVTIAVTSRDTQTHVFKFSDKSLSDVAVGIGPKETRTIAFIAPEKAGEYEFFCDVPGHKARGEVGKMIVK